jgi:hypothetical protein
MIGFFPSLAGGLGTAFILALTALGIFYHYRQRTTLPSATAGSATVTPSGSGPETL